MLFEFRFLLAGVNKRPVGLPSGRVDCVPPDRKGHRSDRAIDGQERRDWWSVAPGGIVFVVVGTVAGFVFVLLWLVR